MRINMKNFKITPTHDGRWMIKGTQGYTIKVDNKHDAVKHCNYLNRTEHCIEHFREQNIEYYKTLTTVKTLAEQIQRESGEIHILQLVINIQRKIKKVMP